jgi:peptidoglycan/xylan/chitin deacetylase (PgdA/CDA1 family)
MRVASLFLLGLLTLCAQAQSRTVAITVDDLICANCAPTNQNKIVARSTMEATNRRLVDKLRKAHIPTTGFVITHSVEAAGFAGQRAIQLWLDAGFDLGSHTESHPNFADISTEQMEAEIAGADATLRPLLAAHRRSLQFFRFPYNDTGDTQAKHDAVAAYLKEHGYQVATCTIDTSDYEFAAAYAVALGADDKAMAERIRQGYLEYSATEIDFYATLNRKVLGYEPPQVMLIHDSLLNADSIDDLLTLFRSRGYSFVSLAQAQRDPAYATPDTYVTKYGPMWGYRWAVERNFGRIDLRETEPPSWVADYVQRKPVSNTATSTAP